METKDLYGRLMFLARSSNDIKQKEAIGNHEFTLTPRAVYAPDGTILWCMNKSMLIHLLNKLATMQPLPQEDKLLEDGVDTKCSKSQDGPSRWNGSSAADDQETSNHSNSQISK